VQLSKEEVDQARDRFNAGVANNIEVIQAQDSLAPPMTIRLPRSIDSTKPAPIWPVPWDRWKGLLEVTRGQ